MPRDEWASTRRRDAIRRAKQGKSWTKIAKPKKSNSKSRRRLRRQSSRGYFRKDFGGSDETLIHSGTAVEIRRGDGPWMSYTTKKALSLLPVSIGRDHEEFEFGGWRIRLRRAR